MPEAAPPRPEAAPLHSPRTKSSVTAALAGESAAAAARSSSSAFEASSAAEMVGSTSHIAARTATPVSVFESDGRPPKNSNKYSSSTPKPSAAADAAVTSVAATSSSSLATTTSLTSGHHFHAAEAAALVGEHVPDDDVAAGGAGLNSAVSTFRRARSRSSTGAHLAALGSGGLSLDDGGDSVGAPSSDGGGSASRPSTPLPSLVEGGNGGVGASGADEEAGGGGGGGPRQVATASGAATTSATSSPPLTPSRPRAPPAAAAVAKVQRPFSKLGAAAAALVARYVACPTRAAAAAERFASAARLVLHFDVNKTIVMTDGAQGAGAGCVVNMMLSECAWGRLEPGAEPPKSSESKEGGGGTFAAAGAAEKEPKEAEMEESSSSPSASSLPPPLPAPQVRWVAVGRLAADRPLADPQLMTYRSFLDSFALPSDATMPEPERERRRKARQDLKRRFTDKGQPGAMFASVHAVVVEELSRAQAAACRDSDGGDKKKQCVEKCVHGHHLLHPTVLPSFFNLLLHLQAQRRRFTIVLRSFGTDLPAVIDEINAFAEGRHPSYASARLDGSDGRVDVRISEKRGHLGAFIRLSSRPEGTSLLLGAPRELLAAREYGPKDIVAAAKATRGAKLLRTFGEIHAAVAGPPPWKNSVDDKSSSSPSSEKENGIVSRALALRDYYPFWKASGERGRAGKLFLLDDGEGDGDDVAGDDGDEGKGGGSDGENNNSSSTPPLSPSPPPPVIGSTEGEAAAAAAAAKVAPPQKAPRDSSQVVHVFFDDNVGHGAANIVDARNVKTGAGIPFADVARAHLVRVEPLGAVLDPAFFVSAVHESVLAASSSSSSSSSTSAATANAAAALCSSEAPADTLLLSPRPPRKFPAVSSEAFPAAGGSASSSSAAAALASRRNSTEGEGNGNGGGAAAAAAPPQSPSFAAAANAPAAAETPATTATIAAAFPGEYCHKCGKVHPPKAAGGVGGVASSSAASAASAAALALAAAAAAAEDNSGGGGGGHHASARGKALWFLARARLMTVVRLGVAARLGGAVHETLEGSLSASVGRGGSVDGSGVGGSRSRSSGLVELLSQGKTIGQALAEKAAAEKEEEARKWGGQV